MKIDKKRQEILAASGHQLIEGGPGSGKTTIALLKAKQIIDEGLLEKNQKILFLSFARASISRVEEQAKQLVTAVHKKSIEINTYHGFCWSIIQSYGYLLKPFRRFQLITPPNLAARLAGIETDCREEYKMSLLNDEGIICFDLFAMIVALILEQSIKIRSIMSTAYPYIIVDEFQDTDPFEWRLIQFLGKKSTMIALADLGQRIYEFRNASVKRIPDFNECFQPARTDLGSENNRSSDTDIVQFGDDILTGKNKGKTYKHVQVIRYRYYDPIKLNLKYAISTCIKRLKKRYPNGEWSLVILVKKKLDTLSVSSYLSTQGIQHEVLIDPAGPALAASVIAGLLEPPADVEKDSRKLLLLLITHLKGRKGDKPSKADLTLASALGKYIETGHVSGSKRKDLIEGVEEIVKKRRGMALDGVPESDWLSIRKFFQEAKHEVLVNVFEDARYLRLLHRGAMLSQKLSEMWRTAGNYYQAGAAIEDALRQEHFSMTNRLWKGIYVMNIHKCKGKEFDEVIIWEERYSPIVRNDTDQQGRLALRVAITRAKSFVTFLTPEAQPCILV